MGVKHYCRTTRDGSPQDAISQCPVVRQAGQPSSPLFHSFVLCFEGRHSHPTPCLHSMSILLLSSSSSWCCPHQVPQTQAVHLLQLLLLLSLKPVLLLSFSILHLQSCIVWSHESCPEVRQSTCSLTCSQRQMTSMSRLLILGIAALMSRMEHLLF